MELHLFYLVCYALNRVSSTDIKPSFTGPRIKELTSEFCLVWTPQKIQPQFYLRLLSLNTGKIFVLQHLRNFYQCDGSMIEFISCDGLLQSMVESFIYSSTFAIVYFIAVRFCGGRSLTVASLS